VLRANLCKLLPVAVRIRYVTRSMDVGEPGSGLLEDPETTIEDLIARIDRKMTSDSEKPKKKRKAKKK
jgi:hypothetical protein